MLNNRKKLFFFVIFNLEKDNCGKSFNLGEILLKESKRYNKNWVSTKLPISHYATD